MVENSISLGVSDTELLLSSGSGGGCGSCGAGGTASDKRCGNGLEKIYPTTAVRFGYLRYIGEFSHPPDMRFTCGSKVVMQTKRGIEIGEQVSLTCSGCDRAVTRDQMKAWVRECGGDSFIFEAGRILREGTAGDLAEYARIQQDGGQKRKFANNLARHHDLPLKVVDCEHLFGGERIIFYFTASERVDFRAMVKDLAREYRTRIEMRQIGARDEARLLADFETCGREICCKVFLKTLKPVSMRMAKLQKATLDPTQVSGRCGRLKCCLRYEHESYEDLDKRLPRVGARVLTAQGDGEVINRQVLTQLIQIRTETDQIITVVAEDIGKPRKEPPAAPEAAARKAPERKQDANQGTRRRRRQEPRGRNEGSSTAPGTRPRGAGAGDGAGTRRTGADAGRLKESAEGNEKKEEPSSRRRGRPRRRRRRPGRNGTDGTTNAPEGPPAPDNG